MNENGMQEVQRRIEYVSDIIEKSKMPKNQIAVISGLTNTYIRDLEKGRIMNADRNKLIAFAVALNLDLNETDLLLHVFDRSHLETLDIPRFINTCKKRKISAALHPLKDLFIYELLVLTVEQIEGSITIVHDMPTSALRAQGHRTYTDRHMVARHKVYSKLVETIGQERILCLEKNLNHFPLKHYICIDSLENYLQKVPNQEEKRWRIKHIENLIAYVSQYPDFHLYLTKASSSFIFSLKNTSDVKENDKLIFMSKKAFTPIGYRAGRLTGFVTENPHIVKIFNEELNSVHNEVLNEYKDIARLVEYLKELIEKNRAPTSICNN